MSILDQSLEPSEKVEDEPVKVSPYAPFRDEAQPHQRMSVLVWLRLGAGAIWTILSYVGGLLAVMSVFGKYGFQWHPDISALIAEYRAHIYPIYDKVLLAAASIIPFHITLTPIAKDVLTLLGLAYSAANSESFIRDGRLLASNVGYSMVQLLRRQQLLAAEVDYRGASDLTSSMFQPASKKIDRLAFHVISGAQVALASVFILGGMAGNYLTGVPTWIWVWILIGYAWCLLLTVVGMIGYAIYGNTIEGPGNAIFTNSLMGEISAWLRDHVITNEVRSVWAGWLYFAVLSPGYHVCNLVIGLASAFTPIIYWLLSGLVLFLISPVLAWRSVGIIVLLLAAASAANWFLI